MDVTPAHSLGSDPMEAGKYSIAVRALCDFTAKTGDLDLRFTPAPTAREGMEGHAAIARRRGNGYETEIALSGEFSDLLVRGRADGYDATANRLEEFKTYRGDLQRMPGSHRAVHWAQLRIYGALLCRRKSLSEVRLALVYFNLANERETVLEEVRSADELEEWFAEHCARFLTWARRELAHRTERDLALRALKFPFDSFNAQQRQLAEAVYRTVRRGWALLAQAPTGSGKTIGTIFPALKAMPDGALDKMFFLVAKTSGRRVALEALARVTGAVSVGDALHATGAADAGDALPSAPLRVLELAARDKVCEYPGAECHGGSCPLARGFYDRLPAAREEGVDWPLLDRESIRTLALKHSICPYYLGQELVRWADVIVGDYNYYFDLNAMLYLLTVMNQWKVTLLVDEAHNLVERGRSMFTAELRRADVDAAREAAPAALGDSLGRLARRWDELLASGEANPFQDGDYRVYDEPPENWRRALEDCVGAISDFSAAQPDAVAPPLLSFYFEAIHFCRLAATLDRDSICDLTVCALSLRNIIPARFTAERWRAAQSSVLFSATLAPFQFYRDVLGLPAEAARVEVGSPFLPEQLAVRVVRSISTKLRHRGRSIEPIAALIREQYATHPGNYLAFFSSYQYLNEVAGELSRAAPDIPLWCQEPAMSEARRTAFLDKFHPHGRGIGFAVLGGVFAEGIDLPGGRLIGAFVATLGLPQLNPVNRETERRIDERFGAGYDYTFLIPGLRKVVQAAGRVVRTADDRGVVYLIDDRFTEARIRELLPSWWAIRELQAAAGGTGAPCAPVHKCGTQGALPPEPCKK